MLVDIKLFTTHNVSWSWIVVIPNAKTDDLFEQLKVRVEKPENNKNLTKINSPL